MSSSSFDFAGYVAARKGEVQTRARDGAAYSYLGERKVRRALSAARPVVIAIEATTRLWKSAAKGELLGTCMRATDQQFPRVAAATVRAAKRLSLSPPDVYVAPSSSPISAKTLGTNDDAYIVINASLADSLSDAELQALLGHELGHIQNNHVLYITALHYLRHSAVFFVRWIVQPAILALQAWSRRAEITCDRAALLCSDELDTALSALVHSSIGVSEDGGLDVGEYLRQVESGEHEAGGLGRYTEILRSHPYLPKRIKALRLFTQTRFYQKFRGTEPASDALGAEEVDDQVSELLSLFS